jgi:hypothetical protein
MRTFLNANLSAEAKAQVRADQLVALVALAQSSTTAKSLGKDRGILLTGAELFRLGLSAASLQEMARKGLITEKRRLGDARSRRLSPASLARIRFVATEKGLAVAELALHGMALVVDAYGLAVLNKHRPATPHWDESRCELRFGQIVVKRFRKSGPNQELVLNAFEESG